MRAAGHKEGTAEDLLATAGITWSVWVRLLRASAPRLPTCSKHLVADYLIKVVPVWVTGAASPKYMSPLVLVNKRSEEHMALQEGRQARKRIAFDGKHEVNKPTPPWKTRLVTFLMLVQMLGFGVEAVVSDYKSWFLQMPKLRRTWSTATVRSPQTQELLACTRAVFGLQAASAQCQTVASYACADKEFHCSLVQSAVACIDDEVALVRVAPGARKRLRTMVRVLEDILPREGLHQVANFMACDAPRARDQIMERNNELGLLVAHKKTQAGRRHVVLGFQVDTLAMHYWLKELTRQLARQQWKAARRPGPRPVSAMIKCLDSAFGHAMTAVAVRWHAKMCTRPLSVEQERLKTLPPGEWRSPSVKVLRCLDWWLTESD